MYVITLHYTVQTWSLPNYQTCFAQGNECKISFRLSFTQLQSHTHTHTHAHQSDTISSAKTLLKTAPSPLCAAMLMSLLAVLAALNAPRTTAAGSPTNVYTVLLVETPASTSSKVHPAVSRIAAAISSITCGQWQHVSGKWHYILSVSPNHRALGGSKIAL